MPECTLARAQARKLVAGWCTCCRHNGRAGAARLSNLKTFEVDSNEPVTMVRRKTEFKSEEFAITNRVQLPDVARLALEWVRVRTHNVSELAHKRQPALALASDRTGA